MKKKLFILIMFLSKIDNFLCSNGIAFSAIKESFESLKNITGFVLIGAALKLSYDGISDYIYIQKINKKIIENITNLKENHDILLHVFQDFLATITTEDAKAFHKKYQEYTPFQNLCHIFLDIHKQRTLMEKITNISKSIGEQTIEIQHGKQKTVSRSELKNHDSNKSQSAYLQDITLQNDYNQEIESLKTKFSTFIQTISKDNEGMITLLENLLKIKSIEEKNNYYNKSIKAKEEELNKEREKFSVSFTNYSAKYLEKHKNIIPFHKYKDENLLQKIQPEITSVYKENNIKYFWGNDNIDKIKDNAQDELLIQKKDFDVYKAMERQTMDLKEKNQKQEPSLLSKKSSIIISNSQKN
jgi:hypothetical protein